MWNPLLDLIANFHISPVFQELFHHSVIWVTLHSPLISPSTSCPCKEFSTPSGSQFATHLCASMSVAFALLFRTF